MHVILCAVTNVIFSQGAWCDQTHLLEAPLGPSVSASCSRCRKLTASPVPVGSWRRPSRAAAQTGCFYGTQISHVPLYLCLVPVWVVAALLTDQLGTCLNSLTQRMECEHKQEVAEVSSKLNCLCPKCKYPYIKTSLRPETRLYRLVLFNLNFEQLLLQLNFTT